MIKPQGQALGQSCEAAGGRTEPRTPAHMQMEGRARVRQEAGLRVALLQMVIEARITYRYEGALRRCK
eukprot:5208143-Alexandrium_andersonii.AAC.1